MDTNRVVYLALLLIGVALSLAAVVILIYTRPWERKGSPCRPNFTQILPRFIQITTSHPPELRINDPNSIDVKVHYSPGFIRSYECTFVSETKCVDVMYERKKVWSYDPASSQGYPKSILFLINEGAILFKFPGSFSLYKHEESEWKLQLNEKISDFIALNMDKPESTDQWSYSTINDMGVYNSKIGFGFNSIIFDCEVIWKAEKIGDTARKVSINPDVNKSQLITIYSIDGNVKCLTRRKKGQ